MNNNNWLLKDWLIHLVQENNKISLVFQIYNINNNFCFKIPFEWVQLKKFFIVINENYFNEKVEIIKFPLCNSKLHFNNLELIEEWDNYYKHSTRLKNILEVFHNENKKIKAKEIKE